MSSRGVKKPKLRDLSQEPLTSEESLALIKAIDHSLPPIALAILGQVLVEHDLDNAIRRRLPRKDDKTWAALIDERGPLSTFSRKVTAAHALKIIDDATKSNMDIIRVVRNAFAHSRKLIDFDHPLVGAELTKIVAPGGRKRIFTRLKTETDKKHAYLILCMVTSTQILARMSKSVMAAAKRRKIKPSPLYRLLAPSFFGVTQLVPKDGSKSPLQSYLDDHTVGPKSPAQGGLLAGPTTHRASSFGRARTRRTGFVARTRFCGVWCQVYNSRLERDARNII
jgi:hypothetical protein